mmetsp:Transcript_34885/g.87031  ORF Transcript_34885/g.87031 Transcript_34885/m.87031 type:complete len:258 (+) Transcript_34885:556-1329(+)
MDAKSQGSPKPTKTFTELEPVTLVMELSAVGSLTAAMREANVSGSEVPSATSVMAVIGSEMPTTQPRMPARSATKAVVSPMSASEKPKAGPPPHRSGGGTSVAAATFHGTEITCTNTSPADGRTGASPPSAPSLPPSVPEGISCSELRTRSEYLPKSPPSSSPPSSSIISTAIIAKSSLSESSTSASSSAGSCSESPHSCRAGSERGESTMASKKGLPLWFFDHPPKRTRLGLILGGGSAFGGGAGGKGGCGWMNSS